MELPGGERDKEENVKNAKLGLKDYLALMVAAVETFLLPLIILVLVMVVLAILFAARL